nr:hypothetical protein CFP56_13277 [Quercus suber]
MDLVRLEQQRLALEANLQQLRKGLKHWQTLDAEYEGLKEEIQGPFPETVDATYLDHVAKTYGGDLVDEQEVRVVFGLDKNVIRSPQQIIDVVERRQEYVGRNLDVIRKRFFEAEAKLEEFDFQAMRSKEGTGDGDATDFPLMEIVEELDEEDNVLSSRLEQPEASHGRLIESLRKAGLTDKDLDDAGDTIAPLPLKSAITNASPPITPGFHVPKSASPERSAMHETDNTSADERPNHAFVRKKSVSFSADTKAAPELVRFESEDGKKSVSFADKVAVAPAAPLPDPRSVSFSPKVEEIPAEVVSPMSPQIAPTQIDGSQDVKTHVGIEKDLKGTFKPGDKVLELDENDEIKSEHLVLPDNETAEEAQLRREMLDYHLNEVGHVVAEINLVEGDDDGYGDDDDYDDDDDDDTSSRYTGSTYLGDEDTPYVSGVSDGDDDEDEDSYGRSKHSYITEEYQKEMQELQMKLIGNLGAAPKDDEIEAADPELDPSDVRKLVIRDKHTSASSLASDDSGEKKTASGKKRVSFAEELDVAEPGSPPLKAQKHSAGENVGPVSSTIAERTAAAAAMPSLPAPAMVEKTSRFKQSRAVPAPSNVPSFTTDMNESPPTFAAGQTLAESLVERPVSQKPPPSIDEPDPIMQRRELAAAYYQRRNDLIKQQGGFKRDEEEEELLGPLMEEKDGKIKKNVPCASFAGYHEGLVVLQSVEMSATRMAFRLEIQRMAAYRQDMANLTRLCGSHNTRRVLHLTSFQQRHRSYCSTMCQTHYPKSAGTSETCRSIESGSPWTAAVILRPTNLVIWWLASEKPVEYIGSHLNV